MNRDFHTFPFGVSTLKIQFFFAVVKSFTSLYVTPPDTPTFSPDMSPSPTPSASPTPTPSLTPSASPSPSATPTLAATQVPGALVMRLAVASASTYTDSTGQVWQADQSYYPATGGIGEVGDAQPYIADTIVQNTPDPALYQQFVEDNRWEYRFDVAPGTYQVTLKMVNTTYEQAGQGFTDIYADGYEEAANLDLAAVAGYYNAYDMVFQVPVAPSATWPESQQGLGILDLVGTSQQGVATVSAIEIEGLQANPTPTPTATTVTDGLDFGLNAGGPSYTDNQGVAWQGDQTYAASPAPAAAGVDSFGWVQSTAAYSAPSVTVTGATDPTVFKTWREGSTLEYKIAVPNGSYDVTCGWAELAYDLPGQRVFDVQAQGQTLVKGVDLNVLAPFERAYQATFRGIVVSDNALDLRFVQDSASQGAAFVSSIRVAGEQALPSATPSLTASPTPPQSATPSATATSTPYLTATATPTATESPTYTPPPPTLNAELSQSLEIPYPQNPAPTPVALDGWGPYQVIFRGSL